MELSERAREIRNAYQRAYRRKNPDKLKEYNRRYWERKAVEYTPEVQAKELKAQGFTQREIADELGVSAATINKILNKE